MWSIGYITAHLCPVSRTRGSRVVAGPARSFEGEAVGFCRSYYDRVSSLKAALV